MPRTVKTLIQLIGRVRDILEEPVPARWSNDMIKDYLNKAQEDLAILAERLKTSEVTLKADLTLTGTVKVEAGSLNAVIGTGTAFLTELSVGNTIKIGTEKRIVATITDNEHLTVTVAFTTAKAAGSSIILVGDEGRLSFPNDFLMLNELFWTDGTYKYEIKPGSSKIPVDDDTDTDTISGPQYYYLVNGAIEIRPIQSTDTEIIIVYYEDPPEMVNNEDKPYFSHSQDALIAGAVWMAYRDDNDPRQQPWLENYSREQMRWLAVETQNYQDAFQQESNW